MSARRLKRTRCLECRELAETTVLGRCPRCVRIDSALLPDWTIETSLMRSVVRHDRTRLALCVRHCADRWRVHAVETGPTGVQSACEIATTYGMPDALAAAERFGRRWLEGEPGTSIATYVQHPAEKRS